MKKKIRRFRSNCVFATSDWHVGDIHFLYDTLVSCFERARKEVGPEPEFVVNGDLLAGRGIYRLQEFDSLGLPWQILAACQLMSELSECFRRARWLIVQGNHDRSGQGWDVLFQLASIAKSSFRLDVEIVGPELLGEIGGVICFHHGFGASSASPHSPSYLRAIQHRYVELLRQGVRVERFVHGHNHWLTLGMRYGPFIVDSLGGFQAWVRQRQRLATPSCPGGAIYHEGGAEEVLPDPKALEEVEEDLAERNFDLYVALLRRARRNAVKLVW